MNDDVYNQIVTKLPGYAGGGEHPTVDTEGWHPIKRFWPHFTGGAGDGYEYSFGGDA